MSDPRTQGVPENFNEAIRDRVVRHMLYLERLKSAHAREVLQHIDNDILPDLRLQLAIRLDNIRAAGVDKGPVTTARLEAQIASFEEITRRFADINTRVQGDLLEIGQYETQWFSNMLNEEAGVRIDVALPSPEQVATVVNSKPFDGRTLEEWYNRLGTNAQQRLSATIKRGVVEGRTTGQITRDVMADMQIVRRHAEAIARSGMGHAANAARTLMHEQNSDIVQGEQINATLDTRTCPTCGPLDGKVYELGVGPRPPFHVSCRCTVTPVLKSWRALGIDADEVPAGTRASMNGQVASDITYNQWLKKQPLAVQAEALGKTRAQLFRKGELDVGSFVNNRRELLTLKQLREKEQQAFKKADIL